MTFPMLALAVALALALAMAAVLARRQRAATRRVLDAVVRLDGPGLPADGAGLDDALTRLERATDDATGAMHDERIVSARMAAALGALSQAVVICDERGGEVFRNEVAVAFAGGRHAEALVEQAIGEQLDAALGGVPQRRNLDLFGPPRRMLVITAIPLDDGTRTTGAVAVVDDVSERRRLEAVRRDFVANISHELKTPVGALALLAETLAAEDDPALTHRLAQRMESEAIRVGRIIDDLLDLSRIEAEESPLREPVALQLVAAEAVERVRPLAERKAIAIAGPADQPRVVVRGDRRQLVSAVFNLLENAVKYSDAGQHVDVGLTSDGRWVELAVRDHGIGIPARDLERVFERFYRVDRARSRETGGTGLGLAIVRHVVSNHHGDVRVESHEGEGSVFTLRLPALAGAAGIATSEAG